MQRLTVVILLTLLTGCMAGPNYRKPDLPAGKDWVESGGQSQADSPGDQPWWLVLGDERLNALMDKALAGNLDVQVALARIKEAQAGQSGAVAQLLPNSSGQLTTVRTDQNTRDDYKPQTQVQANLNISWEIDLLGGNRRELEARTAEKDAAWLNRDAALLAMTVEVARAYVQLRDAAAQIMVLTANIATQKETLRQTTLRQQYGLGSALEVAQASRQVSATQAELHPLLTLRAQAVHRLELLLGQTPGSLPELDKIPTRIDVPQASLVLTSPGSVLVRRPDVALAERQLAASVARQGVSRAAWLPRLSLSALLGTASASPDTLLFMTGQTYTLGGSVAQTLLDFGRVQSQIRASDARAEAQLATLKQRSLTALSEVEIALAAYGNAEHRRKDLTDTEAKAEETFQLSRKLYLDGLGQFLNVLDAQRELLNAQQARTAAEAAVVRDIVDLESAMGGSTYVQKPLPSKNDPPLMDISLPPRLSAARTGASPAAQ
ncbi:efflux transporter outer membrane subunit [Fundidesulfovibrio terrae]|uniref:efflux transporter outer membrane subunit n=1 Tax=Fundidesulfovibrio terrae TaxID=2922866 RepID=UPI001FAF1486|nr:efflux transporter outer membrane subunit [Fundidesulfovibrio terrae]